MKVLIENALRAGYTHDDLARLAGCSRMQIYRLKNGVASKNCRAGKELSLALGRDVDQALDDVVQRLQVRLPMLDARRRQQVLAMLQNVTELIDT